VSTAERALAPVTESSIENGQRTGGRGMRLHADRAGERLDVLIARLMPDLSRSTAQRLISSGLVEVGGRSEKPAYRVVEGDVIVVRVPEPAPIALTPEPMALDVLYEDQDLLVLNKPSGMVVHPGPGHPTHTLVHGLLAYSEDLSGIGGEQRPGIVHRLDRDTSGVLVVAKHDRAHAALSRQFQARAVSKFYLAVVQDAPAPRDGIVDAPIGRHPADRQRMAVRETGRPARTRYHTLGTCNCGTLIVARLETGRTHQLRVHFAAMGCPIAGDPLYGSQATPAGRLWLHSWRLGFAHPRDGRRLEIEAPLPPDMAQSCPAVQDLDRGTDTETLDHALHRARRWAQGT
jgi:23S rRNA pseudouridine1911/1915/1917 synthase